MKKLPPVRKILCESLKPKAKKSCGVLLSAGVDSHSVLHACLDVGIKPAVFSFTLADRTSRDFVSAEKTAAKLGLDFYPIRLRTDLPHVIKYLRHAAKFGVKGKAAFECCYPMFVTAKKIGRLKDSGVLELDYLFSGYGADAFFALSKKGCMHYRDKMAEYATEAHTRYVQPGSQLDILKRYFKKFADLDYGSPWCDANMLKAFTSKTYSHDDLNKPKQKWPVRSDFAKEFDKAPIFNHTNYQLGDSGISDLFLQLLDHPINSANCKSTVGIYNAIVREVSK